MSRILVPWKPRSANSAAAAARRRSLVARAPAGVTHECLKHPFHRGKVAGGPRLLDRRGLAGVEAAALARFGRIDVLVTCAGILRDRMIFNMSEEEWDAVLAVHLKGTFNCVRHACTHMREQRWGRIVTFSSGSGLFGNPGQANYGAAKSAIGGLTKVAARDLGRYGVTVNAICPVAGTRVTINEEGRRP